MVKTATYYYCEKCGKQHTDKLHAEACESLHYDAKKITKVNYDSYNDKKSKYPESITVKLSNGVDEKIVTYYRK